MNILFYFGGFASVGGIETFCKNLLLHLHQKKYNVALVCWGTKSALLKSIVNAGIRLTLSPWRWGSRWKLPDWMLLPFSYKEVKKADIFIFGKYVPRKIILQLRKKSKSHTPFIFITPYRPIPPENPEERKGFLELFCLFDLIIVQTTVFEQDLRQLGYKGEIAIIPYITEQRGIARQFPIFSEIKIGFLGRFVEDKNIPLLLQAFKKFQKKYLLQKDSKDLCPTLHLFGNGKLRPQLEKLTFDISINNSVFFYGDIPNADIEKAISSCHLFAFASHIEGQCLAALEILSYGRPIVATDAGAFPDILLDNKLGNLVIDRNPEEFSNSLLELTLLIEELKITPQAVCAAYTQRYAPSKIGTEYEKLFRRLGGLKPMSSI